MFTSMYVMLSAPLSKALRARRALYGNHRYELNDDDLSQIPEDVLEELEVWVQRAETHSEAPFLEEASPWLVLDAPDTTIDNIVRALRRERDTKRRAAAEVWAGLPDGDWLVTKGPKTEIDPQVLSLADLPIISERLDGVRKALARAEARKEAHREARKRAEAGIRAYVHQISDYARAAKEGYDVSQIGLTHYLAEISKFDEDAILVTEDSNGYKKAKLDERKAPNSYAFAVHDRVAAHLEKLTKPDGVETILRRIQRYRAGINVKDTWTLAQPVTVVVVEVRPLVATNQYVIFFADSDDNKKNFVNADDEIPF
jgi:hypothetical protein